MIVLPVLDILNGVVVRGIAGERDTYAPVKSELCSSADVLTVAHALRDAFALHEFYIADLDAILHDRPNWELITQLQAAGFRNIVDAGLRDIKRAEELLAAGACQVIAGLETSTGPLQLQQLCQEFGSDKIIFSLDMQAGKPLTASSTWRTANPLDIALEAIDQGISQMILLDLQQVGMGAGVSTLQLCNALQERVPQLKIITGGGVASLADLIKLQQAEIDGVLVASALHNGSIGCADLIQLASTNQP